jgi:hypothetical protein
MAVNDLLRVPERFAIDWVKLGSGGRIFTDGSKLASYAYYGTPIHATVAGMSTSMTTPRSKCQTSPPGASPSRISAAIWW